MADNDDYDLGAVEAELARMQQRRNQRSHARLAAMHAPASANYIAPVAVEFELNEVELSPSTTDSEDDSDNDAGCRVLGPTATHRRRLADSLDLSMSLAEVPMTQTHDRWASAAVATTVAAPLSTRALRQSGAPQKRRQQRHHGEEHIELLENVMVPVSDNLYTTPHNNNNNNNNNNNTSSNTSSVRDAKSAGAPARVTRSDNDSWTSDLVRRRRQLERDSGVTTRCESRAEGYADDCYDQQTAPPLKPAHVSAPRSDASVNSIVPPSQMYPMRLKENLQLASDHSTTAATTYPVAATTAPSLSQSRRIQAPSAASQTTPIQPPLASASALKPPQRYASRADSVATPTAAAARVLALRSTYATTSPTADVTSAAVASVDASSARAAPPAPIASSSIAKRYSEPEDNDNDSDSIDDDDATAAEEKRLRQSLAKLDSRLTALSATTRQQPQPKHEKQQSVPAASISTASTTASARRHVHSDASVDAVDDSAVAAASYGGGAHCRSGQKTTALERATYARRVEMSSGTHKLRVRAGGGNTAINDSSSSERDAKHKVVVKKDLAHLLF